MKKYLFYSIEQTFVNLLSIVKSTFSESEIIEVQEYIDAGEYGLALDTFIDIIIEEDKIVSSRIISFIEYLTRIMELDNFYVEKISTQVKNR